MIKKNRKIIVNRENYCKNWISQSIGLMFSKKKVMVFCWNNEAKRPIHMFFVFFPIDLFYLNQEKKVIEIARKIRPFTFYHPKKTARYLIEAPVGFINLKDNDILDFP